MPFQIPETFLQKIYELTGKKDSYKGFVLFYFDSEGNARSLVPREIDSATMMGLRKTVETWCEKMNERDIMGNMEEMNEE